MIEKYISYEAATLAKKIGFEQYPSEQSDYCYLDNSKELFNQAHFHYSRYITDYSNFKDHKIDYLIEYYYAPTQGVLQKWIREKYNIYVYPNIVIDEGEKIIGYKFIFVSCNKEENDFNFSAKDSNPFIYNTYEEALEQGLIKALELIEKTIK